MDKIILLQMAGANLKRRLAPSDSDTADLDPDLFDKGRPVKYLLYLAAKVRILRLQLITSNKVAEAVLKEQSRYEGRRLCAQRSPAERDNTPPVQSSLRDLFISPA